MIIEEMFEFSGTQLIVQIFYGGLIAILLLFGSDLLGRYVKADKRQRMDAAYLVFFVIGFAVLGYGFYMIIAIENYFYERIDWILDLQQFIVIIIILPLGIVAERISFKRKFKFSLTSIIGGAVAVYTLAIVIIDFIDVNNVPVNYLYFIPTWISFAVFGLFGFFGFVYILFKLLSPQKEIKQKILLGLFSGVIALIGSGIGAYGRTTSATFYIIGTIIEILGWVLLRYFFISIPSYNEFEWKDGMVEVHVIIADTGISLYYQSFANLSPESLKGDVEVTMRIPESERPNTDLIGGGMIGISGMLKEIAGTKGKLETIQIGEKSLIFKQGEVIMCLLLCDKNLGVYHSILKEAVEEIELQHPDLINFNGDTRQLHIGPIIEDVFGIKNQKSEK